ncbi:MAG: PAS domain-containing protein [Caldimonas sp.]
MTTPEMNAPRPGDADGGVRHDVATALRESEARYRLALTAGRMGSWETDLVARTRTWSNEGMALFGLDLVDGLGVVGGPADEYEAALHAEDRHLVQQYHAIADKQDSFLAEYRIVRPDGAVLWLSGRGLVVDRQPDGRARRLVSIMADVSERRLAEDVLRIERERLALALKAGQMGVYDFNIADDVLWWSPQTYGVFGVTPDSFEPTSDSVSGLIHPDDRDAFLQRRAEAMAQHRPFLHEFRIVRHDGALAWIGHRGQTEYDAAGNPVRNFGIALDITERKLAEQALRDADRKKDTFIATLAHELRNPLAPIRNAVSVLRQNGQADPQVLSWCRDVIDRQVAQMSRLLEDLLDVSRMTRGQFALRRERLAVAGVIEQAIEIAQPLIQAAGHVLAVEMPAHAIALEGDLTRLAQVFSNLLINAAKYTQPKGRIGLAVEVCGDEVVVSVSDSGIGIAAEQMPHIFEMFGQVETALDRSQEGLGIGLSLARGFVEMHGGRIAAHSEGIGKGSVFTVSLPLSRPAGDAGLGDFDADALARAPASGRRRILIADDLRDSADSLALLLETMGHEVHVAYNGEEAFQAIEALRPEVALLDLGMPKMSGYDVCRRIRGLPWGRRVTLIAQSGWGQDEDRRRTRDAGFDHHIVKPIDTKALDALLRSLVTTP